MIIGGLIYGGAGEALYFASNLPSRMDRLNEISQLLMQNKIDFRMSIKKRIYRIYINNENLKKISPGLSEQIKSIYRDFPKTEEKLGKKDGKEMRYFSEPKVEFEQYITYGKTIRANHPIYDYCTVYQINGKGLAIIQQRFDPKTKSTSWGPIDEWLTGQIYLNPKFLEYFEKKAAFPKYVGFFDEGKKDWQGERLLYPTVTVRQIMWALRMKPLKKQPWETVFDRSPI